MYRGRKEKNREFIENKPNPFPISIGSETTNSAHALILITIFSYRNIAKNRNEHKAKI